MDEKDFYNQLVAVRKEVGDRAILRAIHLFNENKRVEKAVSSLKNNDFDTFKQVIKDSGDSSYKYLQNVYSNKYPDNQAVSLALALSEGILENHGVCRVHGGGFAERSKPLSKMNTLIIIKKKLKSILVKVLVMS
ncbi:MAG: hypothetical protein ACLR43_04010 [Faecalibacillus faecis]